MRETSSAFVGFTRLTDKVHVSSPTASDDTPSLQTSTAPKTIILYTWGDAHPKHIIKYTDGYRTLFPSSQIILVQCTMLEAMFQAESKHNRAMLPVLEVAFGKVKPHGSNHSGVLIHVMSNSGTVGFISTVMAYQKLYSDASPEPFPSPLIIFDSAPGSIAFPANLTRWSRALALATASWSPFPSFVMQLLWGGLIGAAMLFSTLTGGSEIGKTITNGIRDPDLTSTKTSRLYLYSKGDELVTWDSVEEHIAEVRSLGFICNSHVFEKSPHVGHARMYSEKYWAAISSAWGEVVNRQDSSLDEISE